MRYGMLIIALIGLSCARDATGPAPLYTRDERVSGEIALPDPAVIVVHNPLGPVIVSGEGLGPILRTFVHKSVTTEGSPPPSSLLAAIRVISTTHGDTLFLNLEGPPPEAAAEATALLSLGFPAATPCVIGQARGYVHASDLLADLSVAGDHDVTVLRHDGSCRVATSQGNVTAQVAVPDTGSCTLATGKGDIELSLPADASATVEATAGNGTVTVVGLPFGSITRTVTTFSGILGGGGAAIRLATASGSIVLKKIEP